MHRLYLPSPRVCVKNTWYLDSIGMFGKILPLVWGEAKQQ